MKSKIVGSTMPVLELILDPNESVIAESGELSWMSSSIQLETTTQFGGGGGLFGAVKRMAGGGTLFMTKYTARNTAGHIAFATKVPGQIVPLNLDGMQTYMIHRHGFLASTTEVGLSVGFQQSIGAGIFGGDGFLLQKVIGNGTAWIELSGELIEKELASGEQIRVHPGHVGIFEQSVRFEISRIPGIKNMLFGGDGIFLAGLTGPGKVWLQTLPIAGLAHALSPYLTAGEASAGAAGGVAGALVRGLFK